ncbi:MAG: hypothetical protein ACRC92_06880 [Peptostreptococcaceae bacterium]
MEYILGIGLLALLGSKFIKGIMNNIVFLAIIIISVAITIIYKLPYIISLAICILVKIGLIDFFINIKSLSKSLIKSRKRYSNGYLQKLVNILINCNYTLFSLICYGFLVNELINRKLIATNNDAILISIVVIISIKIVRLVLNKTVNNY